MICTNSLRWLFTVLSLYGLYAKYFFLVSFRVVETLCLFGLSRPCLHGVGDPGLVG